MRTLFFGKFKMLSIYTILVASVYITMGPCFVQHLLITVAQEREKSPGCQSVYTPCSASDVRSNPRNLIPFS